MKKTTLASLLTFSIGLVWLINGLWCKVLHLVPRHQQIVGQILGEEYAPLLTTLIGLAEIVMAVWVWTRWQSRLNALLQIMVVIVMNILEGLVVPELLLWGQWNLVFALMFTGMVYYREFALSSN